MVSTATPVADRQAAPESIETQGDAPRPDERVLESLWTRWLERVIACGLCLAGLWFLLGQLVLSGFRTVPGDLGDSRFNAIVLEHGYRFLRGDAWHRPLWSPRWEFFPHQNVLAYSDNLLGTLPVYALLRTLRLSEFTAFNAWIVVMCIANFLAMYALLRSMSMSRIGAATGGFLFAFAMPRGQQLNHLQLFPQFFTPLCFYFLLKLRSLRPWAVWGVFGCVVFQLYAAVYLGWFLALALGISAAVTLAMCIVSRDFAKELWFGFKQLRGHLLAAVFVAGLALLPMVLHYARAQFEVGQRHFDEIRLMLPRPGSYLLPADYSLLYQKLHWLKSRIPLAHEHVMFSGALALGCILVLLVGLFRKPVDHAEAWWRYTFGAIWFSTVAATLWINGSLWTYLYHVIPGGGAIRAVSRIALLQLLPIGVAAAWATNWLAKRAGAVVAVLFSLLIVFENAGLANYAFSIAEHRARVGRIQAELTDRACETFLAASKTDWSPNVHLDAMWTSLEAKIPTVNGYSGNEPPTWSFAELQHARLIKFKNWMRRHGARRDAVCLFRL